MHFVERRKHTDVWHCCKSRCECLYLIGMSKREWFSQLRQPAELNQLVLCVRQSSGQFVVVTMRSNLLTWISGQPLRLGIAISCKVNSALLRVEVSLLHCLFVNLLHLRELHHYFQASHCECGIEPPGYISMEIFKLTSDVM